MPLFDWRNVWMWTVLFFMMLTCFLKTIAIHMVVQNRHVILGHLLVISAISKSLRNLGCHSDGNSSGERGRSPAFCSSFLPQGSPLCFLAPFLVFSPCFVLLPSLTKEHGENLTQGPVRNALEIENLCTFSAIFSIRGYLFAHRFHFSQDISFFATFYVPLKILL